MADDRRWILHGRDLHYAERTGGKILSKDNKQIYLNLINIVAENMQEDDVYRVYQFALCTMQQKKQPTCLPSDYCIDAKKQTMHP